MALQRNLYIDQGSTFSATIAVSDYLDNPLNLTGFTFRAQLRKSHYSINSTNFTVAAPTPTNGQIVISLTAAQTLALKPGRYVYDVEIINIDTSVTRVTEGIVTVNPGVSKPVGYYGSGA